jgi:hypothetical protein
MPGAYDLPTFNGHRAEGLLGKDRDLPQRKFRAGGDNPDAVNRNEGRTPLVGEGL